MSIQRVILAAVVSATMACGAQGESGFEPPQELVLSGKGDLSSGVQLIGELPFGEALQGELRDDFEMHAYSISAKRASQLTVEITHRGSSSRLDTSLYLYAPTDDGYVRIARDDESGWGQLSKIGITLRKDGEFLAVLGSEDGQGRGNYRIELTCESGDCALGAPSAVDATCPEGIEEMVARCVNDDIDFAWFATGDPWTRPEQAIEMCVSHDESMVYHEDMCQLGDRDWCFEDYDTFFMEEMMADCAAGATAQFVVPNTAGLEAELVPELLHPVPEAMEECEQQGADCNIHVSVLTYAGSPGLEEIAESARVFTSRPWAMESEGPVDADAEIRGFSPLYGDLMGGLVRDILEVLGSDGSDLEAWGLGGSFDRGRQHMISSSTVIHLPSLKRVVVVEQALPSDF